MHFGITETYPAEIIDTSFSSFTIPVKTYENEKYIRENIKLYIDKENISLTDLINEFLQFCEMILNKRPDEDTSVPEYLFLLKNIEENCFVRTKLKSSVKKAVLKTDSQDPNKLLIVLSSGDKRSSEKSFVCGFSSFYFMFSSFINIRNYIDFNALSFSSDVKNKLLRLKIRIDQLFDMLIMNDSLTGIYDCRLSRCVDYIRKSEQTVKSAIQNGCRFYGVKTYSVFSVCDYNFMLFEHNDIEETSVFEFKIMNWTYELDI